MRLPALVLAIAASLGCTRNPPPQLPVGVDYRLLDALAWIQQEVHSESVFCLLGAWHRGRIVVDGLRAPRILVRTDSTVQYEGCDGPGIVGTWHPHSGRWAWACEFSAPDRATFRDSRLLLDLLGCGAGEFRYLIAGDSTPHLLARAP